MEALCRIEHFSANKHIKVAITFNIGKSHIAVFEIVKLNIIILVGDKMPGCTVGRANVFKKPDSSIHASLEKIVVTIAVNISKSGSGVGGAAGVQWSPEIFVINVRPIDVLGIRVEKKEGQNNTNSLQN